MTKRGDRARARALPAVSIGVEDGIDMGFARWTSVSTGVDGVDTSTAAETAAGYPLTIGGGKVQKVYTSQRDRTYEAGSNPCWCFDTVDTVDTRRHLRK
jgi:hypothetical protein